VHIQISLLLAGTTRDFFGDKKVVRLEYEGYVPMAEKELLKICNKVRYHDVRILLT
jgi:molybdopterin synthase catalytic subunit